MWFRGTYSIPNGRGTVHREKEFSSLLIPASEIFCPNILAVLLGPQSLKGFRILEIKVKTFLPSCFLVLQHPFPEVLDKQLSHVNPSKSKRKTTTTTTTTTIGQYLKDAVCYVGEHPSSRGSGEELVGKDSGLRDSSCVLLGDKS